MTLGSFFSGIGGLELGLERAGFRTRWQVEIDPYARKILDRHWPDVPKHGDITKLTGDELEPVDCICGGFPCQDLSYAGKQAGIEASRSGLWSEYARLLGILRPRYVLIENVPGLLVHSAMGRVLGDLSRLGYDCIWRSLRASDFGASHLRKRVFIVAYSPVRGRGELRQPPGSYRLSDGSGEALAHRNQSRPLEPLHSGERGEGNIEAQPPGNLPDMVAHGNTGRRSFISQAHNGNGHHALANTPVRQLQIEGRDPEGRDGPRPAGTDMEDPARDEQQGLQGEDRRLRRRGVCIAGEPLEFAPGPSDPRWGEILRARPDLAPAQPQIRGMADGVPDWLDRAMTNRTKRLSRLGNAVVPEKAEWIGERLILFDRLVSGRHTPEATPGVQSL